MDALVAIGWMIVGALVSLVVGAVFQNPLDRFVRRAGRRIASSLIVRRLSPAAAHERRHRDFMCQDFEDLGLFTLLTWSEARPLLRDPRKHRLEYGEPPGQDWFDPTKLRQAQLRHAQSRKGITAYVYGMTIDHREHVDADRFILQAAKSNYGDLNAIGDCIGNADVETFVKSRLHAKGALAFLSSMPPTRLSLQVSVLSSAGRILALRRSHAVGSAPGLWTFGPNETLVPASAYASPGTPPDSLFHLADRCLAEECGLFVDASPLAVGPIHITWFGVSTNNDEGVAQNVFAVTTSRLRESEIIDRIKNAHSNYEADAIDWIPFSLDDLIAALNNRRWVRFSPLAVAELWRYRYVLRDDLRATIQDS